MEVVEEHRVAPTEICVMGESDAHELCTIALEGDDVASGGIDVAQLKVLICTHPAVEALFQGGLAPHTMHLRMGERTILRDAVRVRGGQTVHLCSNKGGHQQQCGDDDIDEGTPVYYECDGSYLFLMVPRGEKLGAWMCKELGLPVADHWVQLRYGRYTLMKRSDLFTTGVVNNNNDNDAGHDKTMEALVASMPVAPTKEDPVSAAEAFTLKWRQEHEARITMPAECGAGASVYPFTIMGSGESAKSVVECLAILFKFDARVYGLYYENSPLSAIHILPGVAYTLKKRTPSP